LNDDFVEPEVFEPRVFNHKRTFDTGDVFIPAEIHAGFLDPDWQPNATW